MMDTEDFLAHYGVQGMRWGVHRNSRAHKQAAARSKGLGQKQLKSEAARVKAAGGGIRGTLKVRREMIDSGELSKADARRGTLRFARNVTLATITGAAAGVTLAGATYTANWYRKNRYVFMPN